LVKVPKGGTVWGSMNITGCNRNPGTLGKTVIDVNVFDLSIHLMGLVFMLIRSGAMHIWCIAYESWINYF